MDRFVVRGGRPLKGRVEASGSKNAALPILLASLLTHETCEVGNVPDLRDIRTTILLLERLGKRVERRGGRLIVSELRTLRTAAPYELVKQMRASVLVAGPLLARFGCARVPLPGGCAIGLRPVDIHLKGFEELGAHVDTASGDLVISTRGLKAARLRLSFPSVGATENLLMAAALTPGRTRIENAAREPEIVDLARFLSAMGASVAGAGGSRIAVEGVKRLVGAKHRVIADRIEAGTLLLAGAATGGDVIVARIEPSFLGALISALRRAGVRVSSGPDWLRVCAPKRPKAASVATKPHPGFPTDLQAPWMALMCLARGRSKLTETIFEKRFMHAAEFARMGARIRVEGDRALVDGVASLEGAPVMASDLRAGAGLVVAGLAARGETSVSRVYHLDRGYERLERKLKKLGARIRRVGE